MEIEIENKQASLNSETISDTITTTDGLNSNTTTIILIIISTILIYMVYKLICNQY